MSAGPQDAPATASRVLLVIAGTAVSHAAILRTAELAGGSVVTVIGIGSEQGSRAAIPSQSPNRSSRTIPAYPSTPPVSGRLACLDASAQRMAGQRPPPGGTGASVHPSGDNPLPEQVRRTVALAMSVLDDAGVAALGHIAVTGSPARAVVRMARSRGARVVVLDETGPPPGARGPGSGSGAPSGGGADDGCLAAQLRRRMFGSGIVVVVPNDRGGRWVVPS